MGSEMHPLAYLSPQQGFGLTGRCQVVSSQVDIGMVGMQNILRPRREVAKNELLVILAHVGTVLLLSIAAPQLLGQSNQQAFRQTEAKLNQAAAGKPDSFEANYQLAELYLSVKRIKAGIPAGQQRFTHRRGGRSGLRHWKRRSGISLDNRSIRGNYLLVL
jgi:hypothetical protein